jgi:hypothetical protein
LCQAGAVTDVFAMADLCTPWCIRVAVTLGVAEQLADGPRPVAELAEKSQADPDALARVLRHLSGQGVFAEPQAGVFALTDAARQLLHPGVRLGMDLDAFGGRMAHAWGSLLTAVRTGQPAYASVFGEPFWDDLAAHPAVSERFDDLMGPQGHGAPDPEILPDGDWDGVRTVADIGGGTGTLLTAILDSHPSVTGVLVDLPRTTARAAEHDRLEVRAQSFFDPLPPGADVYVLKNVLGDWPDDDAVRILRRCAEAARPDGRIVIVGGGSPGPVNTEANLLMFVLLGGRERTRDELAALLRDAGLTVTASGSQAAGRAITECRPTGAPR